VTYLQKCSLVFYHSSHHSIYKEIIYRNINSLLSSQNKILLNNYTNYTILKNVSFGNISLKKGSIVLLNIDNDNCPIFAKITDIFKSNNIVSNTLSVSEFVVTVQYLFTDYFDIHYQKLML